MRRALLLVAATTLSACGGSRPVEQPAPPPVAPEGLLKGTADAADAPMSPAVAGQVTEAEFKALHTLAEGETPELKGEMLELSDGSSAYVSRAAPGAPAVVVIHEWWGLNDHIKLYADRLAADGYTAIAVDLYGGKVATTADEAMATMKTVDDATARRTLTAAVTWTGAASGANTSKVGVIGWCFGGGWSLRTGLSHSDLDAVVVYYGRVPTEAGELSSLNAPLVGIFATNDQGIPVETIDGFEAALKEAGKDATIHRYDAVHAFANPSNAHYDEEKAGDAWEKVQAFLAEQLKG